MANNQLYADAFVAVDGAVLLEHVSVNISRSTGSQAVFTVAKGYAGESKGAPTIEIDVTNAVPTADFEFNAGSAMKALREKEITVFVAGRKIVASGFIISDSFKHSVNSESTYDFKFRAAFVDYE
jgi:hypothetical protein